MRKRKPDVYFQDIIENIEHIQKFLDGVSEDEFYENVEKQDATSKIRNYRRSRKAPA